MSSPTFVGETVTPTRTMWSMYAFKAAGIEKLNMGVPIKTREEFSRLVQLVVTDNQPAAENSQREVAGERHWLINDLSAKYDFLRAGLGWGHMPLGLVARDLMAGSLVEIKRRAWHVRPLMFVMSRRRGHELSTCEAQFVKSLEAEGD